MSEETNTYTKNKKRLPVRQQLEDTVPYYHSEKWYLTEQQEKALREACALLTGVSDQPLHAVFLEPHKDDPLKLFGIKVVFKSR